MNPISDVPTSNIDDAIKDTYQKWPNDRITMWYFLRAVKNINLVVNLMCSVRENSSNIEGVFFAPLKMCLQ